MKIKVVRRMRTKNMKRREEVRVKIRNATKLLPKDELIKIVDEGMNAEGRIQGEGIMREGSNISTSNANNASNMRKGIERSIQRDKEEEVFNTSKSGKGEEG